MPIMAYSPLAHGGSLRRQLLMEPTIKEIAKNTSVHPLQIALSWTINNCLAMPKAVQEEHVLANAKATKIELTKEDLNRLDEVFPQSTRKMPLDII